MIYNNLYRMLKRC